MFVIARSIEINESDVAIPKIKSFNAEDRRKTLDLGEEAVPAKAIKAASRRGAENAACHSEVRKAETEEIPGSWILDL